MKYFSSFKWLFVILAIVVPTFVYAQATGSVEWSKDALDIYREFVAILSWIWVIPASIAGKLLSNQFAFGEFIGLNTYLRRIRNIMRTFTNFAVWALFLWFIFKSIYSGSIRDSIQKIFKLLVWAILINMSRFLMWVVVDLSLVTTTAVASLPVQVLEKTRNQDKYNTIVQSKYCVDENRLSSADCDQTKTVDLSLSSLIPTAENMWWPIVYMWVGMLWLLDADFIDRDLRNTETIALMELVKLAVLVMFTVPVILLMVVNVVRIFWIWIWIVFSPIIVLATVLGDDMPGKSKITEWLKLWDHLWTFFGLIFQPVIVVGLMWVGLVMMMSMLNIISGGEDTNRAGTLIQLQIVDDTLTTWLNETHIKWQIFKRAQYRTLWFFGEAILAFFSVFLLWWLIKAGFMSNEITKKLTKWAMDFSTNFVKSMPIIPVFGGQSITSLTSDGGNVVKRASWIRELELKAKQQSDLYSGKMNDMFGVWTGAAWFAADQITQLRRDAQDMRGNTSFWSTKVKDALTNAEWDIRYSWHLKELTNTRFGDQTVSNIRALMPGSNLFGGIADDAKISSLESDHGAALWNFIQGMISGDTTNFASSTRAGATWELLDQRVFSV